MSVIKPALQFNLSAFSRPIKKAQEGSAPVKIFFLCEDFDARERAAKLKVRLDKNCAGQTRIEGYFIEYARLCHFRLRKLAIEFAATCDMIIITARGTEPIPAFIQGWLDELGELAPEKLVCGEFIDTHSEKDALCFHQFVERWATRQSSTFFSNLFPQSSTTSKPVEKGFEAGEPETCAITA